MEAGRHYLTIKKSLKGYLNRSEATGMAHLQLSAVLVTMSRTGNQVSLNASGYSNSTLSMHYVFTQDSQMKS